MGVNETRSNYGYAAKRNGLVSASRRSKTGSRLAASIKMGRDQIGPYMGNESMQGETKSKLNYTAMKRFNENPMEGDRRSQARSVVSKQKSLAGSKIGSNAGRSIFNQ